jgi:hypothetical protein
LDGALVWTCAGRVVVLDPFLPIVQDNFGCDAKVGRG